MGNVEPKPKDDLPHPCYKCQQLTTSWYSEYPKNMEIKYRCLTCKEIERKEQKEYMEQFMKELERRVAEGKNPFSGL